MNALERARAYCQAVKPSQYPSLTEAAPSALQEMEARHRTDVNEIYRCLDAIIEHLENREKADAR